MRHIKVKVLLLMLLGTVVGSTMAAPEDETNFLVQFDSSITSAIDSTIITMDLSANFLVQPVGDVSGHYRGIGRLRYDQLTGLDATRSDGVLAINDMQISDQDGTVEIRLFPGNPGPNEWVIPPVGPPLQFFQWFGVFGGFHKDTLGSGGYLIKDWEYPTGSVVYARKTFNRNMSVEAADHQEATTIELIPVPDPPKIEKINIESSGVSVMDPETGKDVTLTADLVVPFPLKVRTCTWTGNNFSGQGTGDPEDKCRWKYKPKKGEGPRRDTYGDKNVILTVVYDFGAKKSAITQSKSRDYKTFFSKKGDDDSNNQPNWFDYWGDDGAVPGLDDANVKYSASESAIASADGTDVTFGPVAGDADGSITVPETDDCAGGFFPGAKGVDLSAISLAHERRHNELDAIGGTDTDGDDVPDSAEAGTSANNADSCNLAGVIHSDYASYGDHEFLARRAELGVMGVPADDWAVPGRQATLKTPGSTASPLSNDQYPGRTLVFPQAVGGVLSAGSALTNSYSTVGVDNDADGLFNELLLDVGVSVQEAGEYSVTAWLADATDTDLIFTQSIVNLLSGNSMVRLVFDGPSLNKLDLMQPFTVGRVNLSAHVGRHSVLRDSVNASFDTALDSGDFDPPGARLTGVVSESTMDSEPDGLHNSLDIIIELEINEPGEYLVQGQLLGTSLNLSADHVFEEMSGGISTQVALSFDGPSIFFHREDGPFELSHLSLANVSVNTELDARVAAWATAAYPYTDFQQSGIEIDHLSYADTAGPLDGDGKFLSLDVMFNISSMVPGPYVLFADLENEFGKIVASTTQVVGLGGVGGAAEIAAVILSFDGKEISASMVDGPYQLAGVTVISDEGTVMDQNPSPYVTAVYSADDFTSQPVVKEEVIFIDGFE